MKNVNPFDPLGHNQKPDDDREARWVGAVLIIAIFSMAALIGQVLNWSNWSW